VEGLVVGYQHVYRNPETNSAVPELFNQFTGELLRDPLVPFLYLIEDLKVYRYATKKKADFEFRQKKSKKFLSVQTKQL
jgi:hypothetical protein